MKKPGFVKEPGFFFFKKMYTFRGTFWFFLVFIKKK